MLPAAAWSRDHTATINNPVLFSYVQGIMFLGVTHILYEAARCSKKSEGLVSTFRSAARGTDLE